MEWDELNETGDVPDPDQEMDFSVLRVDDSKPSEQQPVALPAPEVMVIDNAELTKAGFPEVEGDTAPSAWIPKATQCLLKHSTKLDALLTSFTALTTPSPLQTRIWEKLVIRSGIHLLYLPAYVLGYDVLPHPLHSTHPLHGPVGSHGRMKEKLTAVTKSLTDCYESLSDMHGEGILDGFTPESNLPKAEKGEKPRAKAKAVPKSPPNAGEKAKAKPKPNAKRAAR
eukprot:s2038_g16.t1